MPTSNANLVQASETFEAISAAISETARGRWFLAEYVRRQRNSELQALIDALGRLQGTNGTGQAPAADLDRIRFRLVQMQRLIERAKIEIALAPGSRPFFDQPANENALDTLIHEQEKTTAAVIDAAEFIQEMVWSERSEAAGKAVSERLASLYAAAANSMALTERFRLVARLIDQLQQRLAKTVEACDAPGHAQALSAASEAEANLPLAVRLVVNNGGLSAQAEAQPKAQAEAQILAERQVQVQAQPAGATRPPESRAERPTGTRTARGATHGKPGKPTPSANEILAKLSALSTAEKLRRFT